MMLVFPTFSPTHRPKGVTMVAGTDGSGAGFAAGFFGSYGSISGQPLVGADMALLAYAAAGGATSLAFLGDVVTLVSGKTLWVDSTSYSLSGAAYVEELDITGVQWADNMGPTFVDDQSYNIRIE